MDNNFTDIAESRVWLNKTLFMQMKHFLPLENFKQGETSLSARDYVEGEIKIKGMNLL